MAVTITLADLTPFAPDMTEAKAAAMIEDVIARAKRFAPCIGDPDLDPDIAAAAKAILRDVILRWHDQGSGIVSQKTTQTGPFQQSESIDTSRPRPRFWPSEVKELQDLCRQATAQRGKAFSIDMGAATAYGRPVRLPDGSVVDLSTRPDLWLEYGGP